MLLANSILLINILLLLYSMFTAFKERMIAAETFMKKDMTDSLRGFSIIMIAFAHICQYEKSLNEIFIGGNETYRFILSWGAIGVSVFFFLSGYGCYLSASGNDHIWKWLIKHIIRMMIHYIIAFTITIMVLVLVFHKVIRINEIAMNFFALKLPGSTVWYFKIQILFYIILAVSIVFCKDKAWVLVFAMSLIYAICAKYLLGLSDYWWKTSLCFAFGCFIAQFLKKLPLKINSIWQNVICLIILSMSYFVIIHDGHYRIYVQLPLYAIISFFITIIWCCIVKKNKIYKIIGKGSLDFYLIHIGIVETVFLICIEQDLKIVVFILLSGISAIISYFISEKLLSKISGKLR